MAEIKQINFYIVMSCLAGALLSYYAYIVETNWEEDHNYVPLCDISEHMSCSKAFSSKYGKGFGIIGPIFGDDSILNQPNSFGGMVFYSVLAGLCISDKRKVVKLQIYLSLLSNILSIYLAYVLYFKLYDFCIVCVTTYIINILNMVLLIVKKKKLDKHFFEENMKRLKKE